jgi:16S rRNA (uracil1498-N3)-methyltransferase
MHRFYGEERSLKRGGEIVLSAEESHHLARVLRVRAGDRVAVFNSLGDECVCEVAKADAKGARLIVIEKCAAERDPHATIALGAPLLKGDRFDLILQKSVEIGASRLIPFVSERTIAQPRTKEQCAHKLRRWERLVREATKQCGRTKFMRVEMPMSFETMLAQAREARWKLLLWEKAEKPLLSELLWRLDGISPSDTVFLATGPEGGFAESEVASAQDAGFRVASLGKRILRAETAAIVALALVEARWGEL